MDPLTQGVLGATLPLSVARKSHLRTAGLLGLLSGMAPDLDVLISSSTDPLLSLEYHRQFTHSLIFIPIGGLICALVLYLLFARRRSLSFGATYLYCTLGYATHALLDSCTTYGTLLLWPFSDMRVAWNVISIIDPAYTLIILTLVLLSVKTQRQLFARFALAWVVLYPLFGLYQRDRAIEQGYLIAEQRGHAPSRLMARASYGNLVLWRVIYEAEDSYYVDGVRVGVNNKHFLGSSVPKLNTVRDMPWLDPNSQQAKDIQRFTWFANGYVALDPNQKDRIIDLRYSTLPNSTKPLWGIQLSPDADPTAHVDYQMVRDASPEVRQQFFTMLFD